MNKKQLADIKRTLTEGRTKFKAIIDAIDDSEKDAGSELLLADWQIFIDDNAGIERLASVEGFQSICAISSKISAKQTYTQLMNTAVGNFAEVDLATHLVRELPGMTIKKLPEVPDIQQADFKVEADIPLFVESKYVLNPTPQRLESVIASAVDQLVATGRHLGYGNFDGTVWVFSYKQPGDMGGQEIQALIERIQNDLARRIPGKLKVTFQVYMSGMFGECTL